MRKWPPHTHVGREHGDGNPFCEAFFLTNSNILRRLSKVMYMKQKQQANLHKVHVTFENCWPETQVVSSEPHPASLAGLQCACFKMGTEANLADTLVQDVLARHVVSSHVGPSHYQ